MCVCDEPKEEGSPLASCAPVGLHSPPSAHLLHGSGLQSFEIHMKVCTPCSSLYDCMTVHLVCTTIMLLQPDTV